MVNVELYAQPLTLILTYGRKTAKDSTANHKN
jgi:hypothetical protein